MEATNYTAKNLPTFAVLMIYKRDIGDIYFFDDEKAAIRFINGQMAAHIKGLGYTDEFDGCEDAALEGISFDGGCFAAPDNYNAWCNLDDEHWDGWIIRLKQAEVTPVKSRCRAFKKYTDQEILTAIETYEKTSRSLRLLLSGSSISEIAQAIWANEPLQNVYKNLDVRIARGNGKTPPPIKMEDVLEDCTLPYPQNLMLAVFGEIDLESLPKDIDAGLAYVMSTLTPREQRVLELHYKEDYTREEIEIDFNVGKERVRQIMNKAIQKLRQPDRSKYLLNGYAEMRAIDRLQEEKAACMTSKQQAELIHKYLGPEIGRYLIEHDRAVELAKMFGCAEPAELPDKVVDTFLDVRLVNMPIEDLGLNVRTYNALHRANMNTVQDLVNLTEEELMKVRNLGCKGFEDVKEKLARIDVHLKTCQDAETQRYELRGNCKLSEVIPEPTFKWTVNDIVDIAKRAGHAMTKLDVIVWLLENGHILSVKLTENGNRIIEDMLETKEGSDHE